MSSAPRYRSVPLHRRWINDIIHFGKKSHVMGSLWMKALALVGQRRPELRTAYLPFPWARLYEHPECVCSVVVERTWQGVQALFFEQITAPEQRSLAELDRMMRKLKNVPIEDNGSFRRLIRYSRPPVLVRRLFWSGMLYWWGWLRTKCTGTFALNSFPTGGVITQSAMAASFVLYYGLVEPNGDAQIQIFYDHRIMDGFEVFRIVRAVDATMNRDLAAELSEGPLPAIAPAAQ